MSEAAGDHRVFPPPEVPVESFCLHCGRVYMSDLMIPIAMEEEIHYCCPAEGCTAMGWEFDIFPVNDDDCVRGEWADDEDIDDDDDETPDFDLLDEYGLNPSLGENLSPADSFEPPREWTPESDVDDDEVDAEQGIESLRFTQEDYDRLKQSGEIDRRIAEIRQHWLITAKEREAMEKTLPTGEESADGDEDIPF